MLKVRLYRYLKKGGYFRVIVTLPSGYTLETFYSLELGETIKL